MNGGKSGNVSLIATWFSPQHRHRNTTTAVAPASSGRASLLSDGLVTDMRAFRNSRATNFAQLKLSAVIPAERRRAGIHIPGIHDLEHAGIMDSGFALRAPRNDAEEFQWPPRLARMSGMWRALWIIFNGRCGSGPAPQLKRPKTQG